MVKKKVTKTVVTTVTDSKGTKRKKTAKRATAKRKKAAKKKTTRKSTASHAGSKKMHDILKKSLDKLEKRDSLLIENFVGLQKAMATLSVRSVSYTHLTLPTSG